MKFKVGDRIRFKSSRGTYHTGTVVDFRTVRELSIYQGYNFENHIWALWDDDGQYATARIDQCKVINATHMPEWF